MCVCVSGAQLCVCVCAFADSCPDAVGWEPNSEGRLLPREVNLSALMSPHHLAEQVSHTHRHTHTHTHTHTGTVAHRSQAIAPPHLR